MSIPTPATATPLVSVGIPVYNGENYLEEAIRSVLAQTLDDLELVICDNASSDRTEEICRDYAAKDPRVRALRNPQNLGAIPNYNRVFDESRGRYFKWLAHDDRIKPTYLAATVAALEAASRAVLCNTVVDYIGPAGEHRGYYDTSLAHAADASPAPRLAAMIIESHSVVDFFATFRRDVWAGSHLLGFHGEDRIFLAAMSLRGPMLQLKDPLVEMREHDQRYTRRVRNAKERLAWHDASKAGAINLPTFRLFAEYRRLVATTPMSPAERRACYGVLAQWWFRNWNLPRAAVDLGAVVAPGLVAFAEDAKNRLFGRGAGHTFVEPPKA
ncbi:MAG: glycosyltransferase family 2 protein [Geminicoccaceae bacterium]